MALSGSFDWTLTRNQIIQDALETVGALMEGETPNNDQYTTVSRTLNSMIQGWQTDKIYVWKIEWRTQSLTASSEVTGTDSNVYTCIKNHTGATANKPITGAYYTDFWKESGSTGGVWATSAYKAIGNISFANTEVIGIDKAFWRSGSTDSPLEIITQDAYFAISDKTTTGTPSKLYLEIKQNGNNNIYLWPQPDTATDVLHYAAVCRLQDFDGGSDNADFDSKWLDTIIWNLADRLAIGKYPVGDANRRNRIASMAMILYDKARNNANDSTNEMSVSPDLGR